MECPQCRQRRARRACPALNVHICAVCCGTKRLVEIRCPEDCAYLVTAREHPPAAVVRQQRQDLGLLVEFMRDLNSRQTQLFFLIATLIEGHKDSGLDAVVDDDVADAAAALAATFETSARGVIYEHRANAAPAARLASTLKAALNEAGADQGSAFERDAAVVLRRIEEAARRVRVAEKGNNRALIGLLGRVIRHTDDTSGGAEGPSRLIEP